MANETKRNTAISVEIDFPGPGIGRLCLTFSNCEQLEVRTDRLPADIGLQATLHGLKQKLVDAAALSRNPDTGQSATIDDKYNAVREVYDRLLAGQWNKTRGDGTGPGAGGLLFRALCRLYPGKTPEQIRAFLYDKSKEEEAALRKNPRIAAIIETIKAESAKTTDVDSDDMLADLED